MLRHVVLDARVAMSQDLDGVSVASSALVHRHYSIILGAHARRFTALDRALHRSAPLTAAIIPSFCDDPRALMRMVGFRTVIAPVDEASTRAAPVIVAGCGGLLPRYLPDGFFDRGGVLVTSDRAILDVSLPAGLITLLGPAPPRLTTLEIPGWRYGSPQGVPLSAGHIPLQIADTSSGRIKVIACDRDSTDPIVVAVLLGRGWLLHSVAHWYQDAGSPLGNGSNRGPGQVEPSRRNSPAPFNASADLAGAIRGMSVSLLAGLDYVLSARDD